MPQKIGGPVSLVVYLIVLNALGDAVTWLLGGVSLRFALIEVALFSVVISIVAVVVTNEHQRRQHRILLSLWKHRRRRRS